MAIAPDRRRRDCTRARRRPPREGRFRERQLANVVAEYGVAAGIDAPAVLLYDAGPADAFVFGPDEDHTTVVVARSLLGELDRETQGIVARAIASAVDGDIGLATDIGAVYVAFGLLTTTPSRAVSAEARARWRAAMAALTGRAHDPRRAAGRGRGTARPIRRRRHARHHRCGLPDAPDHGRLHRDRGLVHQPVSGRSAAHVRVAVTLRTPADATSVELSRDPDGLSRAWPGSARADEGGRDRLAGVLLVVDDGSVGAKVAGAVPAIHWG